MPSRPRSTVVLAYLAAVVSLVSACCTAEPTQLVVVMYTDLTVPDPLEQLSLTLLAEGSVPQVQQEVLRDGRSFPRYTVAVHESGSIRITLTAEGTLVNGSKVTREVRTQFVVAQTRVVRLFLGESCVDVACSANETCNRGRCESSTVDSGALSTWTGALPPPPGFDGGADAQADSAADATQDSGSDGGADSGDVATPDASADAPAVDACTPSSPSTDLNCDQRDDDCDGKIDEDYVTDVVTETSTYRGNTCTAGVSLFFSCESGTPEHVYRIELSSPSHVQISVRAVGERDFEIGHAQDPMCMRVECFPPRTRVVGNLPAGPHVFSVESVGECGEFFVDVTIGPPE